MSPKATVTMRLPTMLTRSATIQSSRKPTVISAMPSQLKAGYRLPWLIAISLVQLKPRNPASLAFRGTVYLALRDFKLAKANYEEALALDPNWPHALYGRGLLKIKLGDPAGGNADIAAAKNNGIKTAAEFGINR